MLTDNSYKYGFETFDMLKYNINSNDERLFKLVCAGLATDLLNSIYSERLTCGQINVLQIMSNLT